MNHVRKGEQVVQINFRKPVSQPNSSSFFFLLTVRLIFNIFFDLEDYRKYAHMYTRNIRGINVKVDVALLPQAPDPS